MSTIKINLNPAKYILARMKLDENGDTQKFFSKKCAEYMNPYVPFLTGNLKDIEVTVETNKVVYEAEYAKQQYYTNQGMGKEGTSYGGLRGKQWCNRMKASRMSDLTKEVADYVGGKCR